MIFFMRSMSCQTFSETMVLSGKTQTPSRQQRYAFFLVSAAPDFPHKIFIILQVEYSSIVLAAKREKYGAISPIQHPNTAQKHPHKTIYIYRSKHFIKISPFANMR